MEHLTGRCENLNNLRWTFLRRYLIKADDLRKSGLDELLRFLVYEIQIIKKSG